MLKNTRHFIKVVLYYKILNLEERSVYSPHSWGTLFCVGGNKKKEEAAEMNPRFLSGSELEHSIIY